MSRTCWEHQHRVVPEARVPQRRRDVAHSLVHGGHHARIQPALGVLDEGVGLQVALGHLQRGVDRLQRHVEEGGLEEKRRETKTCILPPVAFFKSAPTCDLTSSWGSEAREGVDCWNHVSMFNVMHQFT